MLKFGCVLLEVGVGACCVRKAVLDNLVYAVGSKLAVWLSRSKQRGQVFMEGAGLFSHDVAFTAAITPVNVVRVQVLSGFGTGWLFPAVGLVGGLAARRKRPEDD